MAMAEKNPHKSLTALNKSKWEKQVTEISESVYNSIQYV